MKISIDGPVPGFENQTGVSLFLTAEYERDFELLELIAREYETVGFGRDPETMKAFHVTIKLEPRVQ